MQRCEFCGSELPFQASFCSNCGQVQNVDASSATHITRFSELTEAAPGMPGASPVFGDPAFPTTLAAQGGLRGFDAAAREPVSDYLFIPPGALSAGGPQTDESRTVLPEIVLPFTLPAGPAPAGPPMVQGTPQISQVPSIQGTPPTAGSSAAGGQAPAPNAMPSASSHAGSMAQTSAPTMPGQHPQQPDIAKHPTGPLRHHDEPQQHHQEHEQQPHHGEHAKGSRIHRPHLRASHTPATHVATASKVVVGTATKWFIVAMATVVIVATSGVIFVLASAPGLSLSGSSSTISVGGTLHIHGKGFLPGGSITLTLDNGQPVPIASLPREFAQSAAHGSMQEAEVLNTLEEAASRASTNNSISVSVTGSFDADVVAPAYWPAGPHIIHAREDLGSRSADLQFMLIASSANLIVKSTVLPFTVQRGAKATRSLEIGNTGQSNLTWSATTDGSKWLTLQSNSGEIVVNGQDEFIDVVVDASQLTPGTYTATIQVQSNGGAAQVKVTLQVLPPSSKKQAKLDVNPIMINLGSVPTGQSFAQSLTIGNIGTASLTWHANPGNASWLTLDTTSGTVQPGAIPQMIHATVDTSGLATESYSDILTISSNGGNTQVAVTLTVIGAAPSPTPPPTPTPLSPTPPPPPTPPPNATWSVSPTSMDNNSTSCSGGPTTFSCTVTLMEATSSNTNITWSANDSAGVGFSPPSSTLTPGGAPQQVSISNIPCQGDTFTFTDNANVASPLNVGWTCSTPPPPPPTATWSVNPTSLDNNSSSCSSGSATYSCTVTLMEDQSSNTNITWSASDSLKAVSFSPPSSTLTPGGAPQQVSISNIPCQGTNDVFTFTDNANVASPLTVTWTCTPPPPPPMGTASLGSCTYTAGTGWSCPLNIMASANNQSDWAWTATSSGVNGITIAPNNGSLPPGQSVTATVTIPDMVCPASATITVSGGASNIPLSWSCAAPTIQATVITSNCPGDSTNGWTCMDSISLAPGSQGQLAWTTSSDLSGVTFSPASGTLSVGQSITITITVPPNDCVNGNFYFMGTGGNTATITWTCNGGAP